MQLPLQLPRPLGGVLPWFEVALAIVDEALFMDEAIASPSRSADTPMAAAMMARIRAYSAAAPPSFDSK